MMVPAPARLEFGTAMAAVADLDRALRAAGGKDAGAGSDVGSGAGSGVGVDLSTLTHFDSSALAVLLELWRRFGAASGRFAVVNPPPAFQALAEVYGVAALLFGPSVPAQASSRP